MATVNPFTPRSICIHGHFYQPPRENPWTGRIDLQPSAAPYHDWNQRIAAECYAPNAAAPILDEGGATAANQNNYAAISFDFGPTLLSWLESEVPEVYAAVLAADRVGHGGMAQAYNHMIMPLANARDRQTQVLWGSRDFSYRFGREPEGMWLPETAVNLATLEDLAAAGIRFTVLAPRQAKRVRRFGSREWHAVEGGRVDPHFAYQVRLPSERQISVFFYDAGLAQEVAFDGLLNDGARFAERLATAFDRRRSEPQLTSVATDGESYGHHHRFGEMALAAALRFLGQRQDVAVTNYRAFLARHPPVREVELIENSSWSCAHGVERWRSNCGCNSGGFPAWNQSWRGPLRLALDWLRDRTAPAFQAAAQPLLWNAWNARNDYIEVVLNPMPAVREAFLARHARRPLAPAEQQRVWALLEMQRFAMLMYTSCGWFFDEVSGIETVQILAYAARVLEYAGSALRMSLEAEFLRRLEAVPSNVEQFRTARGAFSALVPQPPLKSGIAS